MMAITHVKHPPDDAEDRIGTASDVLVWGYGVIAGEIVAIDRTADGGCDVRVEYDSPSAGARLASLTRLGHLVIVGQFG